MVSLTSSSRASKTPRSGGLAADQWLQLCLTSDLLHMTSVQVNNYSITFVGVNGVGKCTRSQNFAYICAIFPCFRQRVELYEKGYGKDAACIAKKQSHMPYDNDFDVVSMNTAGSMQDNEIQKLTLYFLLPDKIFFVGEALVGNETIDQFTKFDPLSMTYVTGQPIIFVGCG
ncbi:hypothetical protein DFH29DRAFT_902019 [Suillus ampliporus]|nr:hypothetical protein DFH29DRAFT_902019 [Suillus ampliporus]